ncbi:MAG TPA: Hsp20/alpha crystallin family protein [Candidatus Kryptonia bacterium]|nr:Hsp20/alpha crystallin family protein [Candidatus Kryptonia bacterium]
MALPSIIDQIDQLFDELIHRPWGGAARQLVPSEVREVADGWIVEFPVEGLRAADLKIEVHGRRLIVNGHRKHEQRQGSAGWTRQEHSLHRTVTLPEAASAQDIEATIAGNTLAIHVRRPKR